MHLGLKRGRREGTKNREGHVAGGVRPGAGRKRKKTGTSTTALPDHEESESDEWENADEEIPVNYNALCEYLTSYQSHPQ